MDVVSDIVLLGVAVAVVAAVGLLAWRVGRHAGVRAARRDLLAVHDVVAREQARVSDLEAELDRVRLVLSALDDAVIVVGPNEAVRSVNDAALALFPTTLTSVRGRRVIEVTGDHEIAALVRDCLRTRERREGKVEVSDSGRIVRAIAVPTENGECLLLARDVTEIQHLQTVRREFVANVSHELRSPLGSIKVYAETLLEGGLEVPGMAEDRLKKIIREVDELTHLTAEILALARIESGREQPKLVPLAVHALLADAAERMEAQAERAGVSITVAVSPGLPPILGDRRMLEGALVNLIHNAVKFTPEGGSVTVGAAAHATGRGVSLWVRDTGVGVAAEHLPRLFERFYKEDRARSRSSGGTGLGLAIVKHVALAHGGQVAAESEAGRGSCFTITLPASAFDEARAAD